MISGHNKTNKLLNGLIAILLLSGAIFLRVYAIADRPFHNDEGVNYFFIKELLNNGYYSYSHENYHGPSYFYLLAFFCKFFGFSELSMRFSSILPSIALSAYLLFAMTYVNFISRLFAVSLLATSTTFVYYSRYAIHETLLVFASILGIVFFYNWLTQKKRQDLILFFLSLGLCVATKETFIIHLFCLIVSFLLVFPFRDVLLQVYKNYAALSWGFLLFFILVFIFYTGGFQNGEGIREFFYGVPQWVGRGHSDVGHYKPFFYYFNIYKKTEPVVLLVGLPLILYFYQLVLNLYKLISKINIKDLSNKNLYFDLLESSACTTKIPIIKLSFLFSIYALVSFCVYSYVPYKTPWLIINITVPALIGFAFFISSFGRKSSLVFLLMFFCLIVSLKYSLRFHYSSSSLGFLNKYISSQEVVGENNPLAYVHTQNGMVEASQLVSRYMYKYRGSKILISLSSYWPLPYYLREFESQLMYAPRSFDMKNSNNYQVIFVDRGVNLDLPNWQKRYFRLGDNQEADVYFKEAIP